MRIGFVTATYLPSRNGVATSTALFAQGLRALGHEVRIFAPMHPVGSAGPDEQGVSRLPSTTWGTPHDYPLLLWPGPRVVARLPLTDLDIVHTMHPFLAGQLARVWSRRFRAPLVFTAHTQYEQYLHYARAHHRAGRSLMRSHVVAFARLTDQVLVPGQAMAQMLRHYGYAGDIQTLPNPVDLQAHQDRNGAAVREAHGIAPHAPLAISLGRLAPEKNLETLLQTYALARERQPDLRLLVVGDGPSRHALMQQAPDDVVFTGAVPHAQVPEYLAAADVFLTASESEVLPMSMIEALASGAPLVAARSPAALDLIRDGVNGMLCEPTAEALATGLERALDPKRLPDLRHAARASAEGYEVQARARQLAGIYERLLAR
ncbi:glycosyltransferase [Deinococcus sonorensis]|uniref:Glycosyltransferase n=2 Tax=Deinococcus sonorensis TaxID=309891 RepID=A0AAU7UC04_9DEIO